MAEPSDAPDPQGTAAPSGAEALRLNPSERPPRPDQRFDARQPQRSGAGSTTGQPSASNAIGSTLSLGSPPSSTS